MDTMKINAVKNLMQSLEFNLEEKEALLHFLQDELAWAAGATGKRLSFELLFADGVRSYYRLQGKMPVAIIVKGQTRSFGLCICREYFAADDTPLDKAQVQASQFPKVEGRSWRVLTEDDCKIIQKQFIPLRCLLSELGCRKIVESREIGVLTSDGNMGNPIGWQVWFAIDLD